jgi:hypothetical protein
MTGCIYFDAFKMRELVYPTGNESCGFVIQGTHDTAIRFAADQFKEARETGNSNDLGIFHIEG